MHPGRRRLFIYYRLRERDLCVACEAVRKVQQTLRTQHRGLNTELLAAPGADVKGLRTVMEMYLVDVHVSPRGVDEALQADIEASLKPVLQPWLQGARHVEVFDELQ